MSIDRQQIVEKITRAGEISGVQLHPAGSERPTAPNPGFSYDVERAGALLTEAGYPGGAGFPPLELMYNTSGATAASRSRYSRCGKPP